FCLPSGEVLPSVPASKVEALALSSLKYSGNFFESSSTIPSTISSVELADLVTIQVFKNQCTPGTVWEIASIAPVCLLAERVCKPKIDVTSELAFVKLITTFALSCIPDTSGSSIFNRCQVSSSTGMEQEVSL